MKNFKIIKQQHPKGCIPACAASVLKHLEIPKPDWSELGLMAMYASPTASERPGFEILKQFLDGQPEMKGWEVVIQNDNGSSLKDLVTGIVQQHGPALTVRKNGNEAHCVVIVEPDDSGALICDPWPDQPNQKHMVWADIENKDNFIGGLLYFKKC